MGGLNLTHHAKQRRAKFCVALATLCWSLLCQAGDARAQVDASTVKATFLYRFASYVTWPPQSASGPIVICFMEGAALKAELERLVHGQSVFGRSFVAERLEAASDIRRCSIAYLNGDEDRVRQWLRAAAAAPVLTVTDAAATPNVRAVVHFATVENRIRFHIDDGQAAEHGLSMDSRLLALAVSVRRRR